MRVITANNVNEALILGLQSLEAFGVNRDSRNGPVKVFPGPVSTEYKYPDQRVLFYPERDANPYFHFMESLWMLSGRRDVEFPARFASNIANYSDDGVNFHGAYGYRWRNHFAEREHSHDGISREVGVVDQLYTIAGLLKENNEDRRVVLQMWDTESDLGMEGKDFPCNLIATFRINPYGKLDMTVFNRSNDIIWGAYGANAVHFSMLQEVMAAWIGVPIGSYHQISTNFHGYKNILAKHEGLINHAPGHDPYSLGEVVPYPVVNTPIDEWFQDLDMFMSEGAIIGLRDPFFKKVAVPMLLSWNCWKDREDPGHMQKAMMNADRIIAQDWRRACMEWLERRS